MFPVYHFTSASRLTVYQTRSQKKCQCGFCLRHGCIEPSLLRHWRSAGIIPECFFVKFCTQNHASLCTHARYCSREMSHRSCTLYTCRCIFCTLNSATDYHRRPCILCRWSSRVEQFVVFDTECTFVACIYSRRLKCELFRRCYDLC